MRKGLSVKGPKRGTPFEMLQYLAEGFMPLLATAIVLRVEFGLA